MPAPPEIGHAVCDVGIVEVLQKAEAEHPPEPARHVRIAGKIEVDLKRIGKDPDPCAEHTVFGGRRGKLRPERAHRVREQDLFSETDRKTFRAVAEEIFRALAGIDLIGDRLVADDVVEIRRVNTDTLVGTAPAVTKHLIELRGIGIIDVKSLFGVECVKDRQNIGFVIKLEDWKKEKEYDRIGLKDEYIDILGKQVVCHSLPIRPGRNLAVICETAAVNFRQKKMGYNATEELYRRVQENMANNK